MKVLFYISLLILVADIISLLLWDEFSKFDLYLVLVIVFINMMFASICLVLIKKRKDT